MATVVQPPPSSSLMWISRVWLSCSTLTRWCGLPCSCRPRIVRPGDGVGATNDVHRPLGGSGRCTVPLLPGCRVCRRPQLRREAERRDPEHQRTWVALVDGNNHQIDRIGAEARARKVSVRVVIDLIHVLEYLWKAAWCFHAEGDPAAEAWVRHHASAVLDGKSTRVAGAIRRAATMAELDRAKRAGADACATYLTNKSRYLDYPTALTKGWPIATGVIEGACRHLVKDRMDLTGARWGLSGAEAILRLRALRSNSDFEDYWRYHLARERHRVHQSRYAGHVIPHAA